MADAGAGRVGSVVGRYWAMDRDRRWDRLQRAYDLLVQGRAEHRADTGAAAARDAYARGETDEFITPVLVGEEARIRPGDSVIAFNFRPDRMREITRALADPQFHEVDRGGVAAGRAVHHDDPVRGRLRVSGRVRARTSDHDAADGGRARAPAPAARRRDREVRARDLLLQRRGGDAVRRRAPRARAHRRATSRPTITSPR